MPHKLEDETLITPTLLRRAIGEAQEDGGDGRHFLVIQKADRSFIAHNPNSPELDGLHMQFAQDCLRMLNDELARDGAWVMLFTHPAYTLQFGMEYQQITALWMDQDGDVQFPMTWQAGSNSEEIDFAALVTHGLVSWCTSCNSAWELWRNAADVLDAQKSQTYRRALGEKAPTQH